MGFVRSAARASRRLRPHHSAQAIFAAGGLRWDRVLLIAADMTLWVAALMIIWRVATVGLPLWHMPY